MQKNYTIILSLIIVPGSIFGCGCFAPKRTKAPLEANTMQTVKPESLEGSSLGMGPEIDELDHDQSADIMNPYKQSRQVQKEFKEFSKWAHNTVLRFRPLNSANKEEKINSLIQHLEKFPTEKALTFLKRLQSMHVSHRAYPIDEQNEVILAAQRILEDRIDLGF